MILTNSKFPIIPSCFDVFKITIFGNDSSSVTVFSIVLVTYLTPQNKFLESLRKITISKNGVHKKSLNMALVSITVFEVFIATKREIFCKGNSVPGKQFALII